MFTSILIAIIAPALCAGALFLWSKNNSDSNAGWLLFVAIISAIVLPTAAAESTACHVASFVTTTALFGICWHHCKAFSHSGWVLAGAVFSVLALLASLTPS